MGVVDVQAIRAALDDDRMAQHDREQMRRERDQARAGVAKIEKIATPHSNYRASERGDLARAILAVIQGDQA